VVVVEHRIDDRGLLRIRITDEVADGVIGTGSTLVCSAAAGVVVGDAITEHASLVKERVVVVDNTEVNDGGGGGDGVGLC
jgi:hypothetical protein